MLGPGGRDCSGDLKLFHIQFCRARKGKCIRSADAPVAACSPRILFPLACKAAAGKFGSGSAGPGWRGKRPERELEPDADKGSIEKIEGKPPPSEVEEAGMRGPEQVQEPERESGAESRRGELQQKKTPIAHMMIEIGKHRQILLLHYRTSTNSLRSNCRRNITVSEVRAGSMERRLQRSVPGRSARLRRQISTDGPVGTCSRRRNVIRGVPRSSISK